MLARVYSCAVIGWDGVVVEVALDSGQAPTESEERALVLGALSLDGGVRHVCGMLPMAALAREEGFERLYVPEEDAREAALIPDLEIIPISSLNGLNRHLTGEQPIPPYEADYEPLAEALHCRSRTELMA